MEKNGKISLNEPTHEIMVLFILRNLILQTRMRSHPVGLDSDIWSDPSSIYVPHRRGGGHIVSGVDPVDVGVSVGVGVSVSVTLYCLHDIS